MIKFTVLSKSVREHSGIGKAGKPYTMFFQVAYAHTYDRDGNPNPFPEKVELTIDPDKTTKVVTPYEPGEYKLLPTSLYMGKYGLEVAPKLELLKKAG